MSKKQKTRYSLSYLISQAFKSLFRNGMMTVASIAVLMSCLTVMGSFALLVHNLNVNLDSLGDLNEIVVYCNVDLERPDVEAIGMEIYNMDNVKSVELKTKEDILEEEKNKYSDFTDIYDEMEKREENPYPDTYVVQYQDNDKVPTLQLKLQELEGVDKVKCRADLARSIESLKNSIIFIFMWFLAILFLVSIFVIINTIKLAVYSRRQEISIMRYVGATRWFITTPFIVEGIVIGIVSSGMAFGIEYFIYRAIYNTVSSNYTMLSVVPFGEVKIFLLAGFAAVGVVTGIIGTSISLGKHLKA